MQGVHCTSDAPWVEPRLGAKRAEEGAYVWQKLMKSGAVVTNGTDAPVEDVDPIASYYATVTRKAKDGKVFYGDQKMSRLEALRSYTINNAFAAFEEDIKGSLPWQARRHHRADEGHHHGSRRRDPDREGRLHDHWGKGRLQGELIDRQCPSPCGKPSLSSHARCTSLDSLNFYIVEINNMGTSGYLGEFEQVVLLAVARLEGEAYGMKIRREIEMRAGRAASIGAVYATLDRLQAKGYVQARDDDAGGRARRFFVLAPAGLAALESARDLQARMWAGLRIRVKRSGRQA